MENALSRIELYNTLFYIFAAFAAVSFVIAVVLFFRFDIPQVYAMLTGKSKRRTIERMEKRSAQTGKMRRKYPIGHTGNTGAAVKETPTQRKAQPAQPVPKDPAPQQTPTPRQPEPPANTQRPETAVLRVDTPETVVLQIPEEPAYHTEDLGKTEVLSSRADPQFHFQVTENLIEIHTNELI